MPVVYLTHLYPKEMSIYGDMGNIITIKKKLAVLGFETIYQPVGLGDKLPIHTDFYFIGGGQDNEQIKVFQDLQSKEFKLLQDIEIGVPLLAICGGYQLLGESFLTGEGVQIPGLKILPVKTVAPNTDVKSRCTGNIITSCNIPEIHGTTLVGFENHSGQTSFVEDSINFKNSYPLGKVLKGFGNNLSSMDEGCVYKNVIGTYLHGSCLPKNPQFANYLLKKIFEVKSQRRPNSHSLTNLNWGAVNDEIALATHKSLIKSLSNTKN